jgi:DNA-binding beta-propeller fold protein YncE
LASILPFSLILVMAAPSPAPAAPSADSAVVDTTGFHLIARGVLTPPRDGHGQVVDLAGVASDAFGRIWLTDSQLHRIQRFDRKGEWLGETGGLGSDVGQLRRPGSVAPLGAANMAVLDRENRRVLVYDLFGRLQGVRLDLADEALESQTGRVDPAWLATDRGGALFITDPARERLLIFDTSGRLMRAVGSFGSRVGTFRGLRALAVAPHGELIVTERLNARVQKLDAGGRPIRAWTLPIETKGGGGLPVAVDESGRVAVADETSGRLWVFDAEGRRLAELSGLSRPRALAFAPDGTLLVAEGNPAQVRRFELSAPTTEP